MEYKLVINGTLPNLNDFIAQLNINKFRGSDLKRKTESGITVYIKKQLKGVVIQTPVFVEFTWIEPDRKRDKDNIAFAKKFVFDALVKCGVLPNDGWAWVQGFADNFDVDTKNPRIEVVIKEQPK